MQQGYSVAFAAFLSETYRWGEAAVHPQLFKFAAAHQKANSLENPVCWPGVMDWGEKSRIQQLRERKLQELRVECLMPLLAVLPLAVHSTAVSARGGRETFVPRVSPQSVVGQRKGVLCGVCVKGEAGRDELPVLFLAWPVTFSFSPLPGMGMLPWSERNVSSLLQHWILCLLNPARPLAVVLHTLQDFTGTAWFGSKLRVQIRRKRSQD